MATDSSISRFLLLLRAGSSSSPFGAFVTGFGFGFGFGWHGLLVFRVAALLWFLWHGRRLFRLGFLRLLLAVAVSSSPSSSPAAAAAFFFFFVGEAFPLSSSSFAFALTFFLGPFFTMSRSPDASDAVAPPSSSELDSVGEPSSGDDA